MNIIDLPFKTYLNIAKYFSLHGNLVQENVYLKQLYKLQTAKLQKLNVLELENDRLKNLLSFTEVKQTKFSLAKLVDVTLDPFRHQIVLNKGKKDGTYVGQPILNADGILGSVVAVEQKTSLAILITDINYAVPVYNLRNGFRAIALGTGDPKQLVLQHVPNTADVIEQDVFVTSGLGGKYPAGYVVGYISKVKKDANLPFASIMLTAAAKLDSFQEVLLIDNGHN